MSAKHRKRPAPGQADDNMSVASYCSSASGSASAGTAQPPCPRCERTRASMNPIQCTKYPGAALPFTPSGLCVPCNNLGQRERRGVPTFEVTREISNTTETRSKWLAAVSQYESDFVKAALANGRVSKSRDYGVKFTDVIATKKVENTFRRDNGKGWPRDIWVAHFVTGKTDYDTDWEKN